MRRDDEGKPRFRRLLIMGGSRPSGVAPVLTSPTDTTTGSTTATLGVSTDTANGTLYWVITTSATPPSKAQVKAGQNDGGSAAAASGNQAVSATGAQAVSATGLTAATAYFSYFMHESSGALQSNVSAADGFTTHNAETTTWVNAVVGDGGTVSAGRKTVVDSLITSLKSASIWTKLDRLWLFAAENPQGALRDIIAASAASVVNAPTFTTDRGYTGNGTTSYVNSGFVPSSAGGALVQDSAHISAWSLTSAAAATASRLTGTVVASTPRCDINPRAVGDLANCRLNDATASSIASASTLGHFIFNRSASNARQLYRNGSSLGTDTQASTGLPTQAVSFCADPGGSQFNTIQIASGSVGSSLSGTNAGDYYNALLTYMQAVGAA